jgi:hypothetical protein
VLVFDLHRLGLVVVKATVKADITSVATQAVCNVRHPVV